MKLPGTNFTLFIACSILCSCSTNSKKEKAYGICTPEEDSLFFARNKGLLTATWNRPFGYETIKSNHAPLGPYMGNGDVGVVAFTSDNSQTLKIAKVDFITDGWTGEHATWTNDPWQRQPEALPVGGVRMTADAPVSSSGFIYRMDQLSAELKMKTATDTPVEMLSWIAADSNVIVTELRTAASAPVRIQVDTYADSISNEYATTANVQEEIAQVTRSTRTDNMRWVSRAGISTQIIGAQAEVHRLSDACTRSSFTLQPSQTVYVVNKISGGGKNNDAQLQSTRRYLSSLDKSKVEKLNAARKKWWKDMWSRSYVETGDTLIDRQYLTSIYLLASAYNEHSPACGGMYGVWNMEDNMMYRGDIHLNYNSQAAFYSVFSANRANLALPYYASVEKMVPEGKRRAREELGLVPPSLKGKSCRGILFPVSAFGTGELYSAYWSQTMNAPFNVPLFSWYYEYTGDKEFLRNRAYPYILECGNFYEDYMQKETYGNSYRYTIVTGAHEGSWDVNPPSDLGFVEQTFSLLLKYSKLLGVDADRRALWQDILTHLPAYKTIMPTKEPNEGLPVFAKNENGWDHPAHMIQMHPVYPCEVLNLRSDSALLQTARNTIYYYGVSQKGFTHVMNELGLSAFVMGARTGFPPEILMEGLKELARTAGTNFLITDGHHCTEKAAVIETINSMMLQSVDDILYLYPCWIKKPARFVRLRAKGAFIVSADYDGQEVSGLKIYSEQGNPCKICNPWQGSKVSVKLNGKPVSTAMNGNIIEFSTKSGTLYEICKR